MIILICFIKTINCFLVIHAGYEGDEIVEKIQNLRQIIRAKAISNPEIMLYCCLTQAPTAKIGRCITHDQLRLGSFLLGTSSLVKVDTLHLKQYWTKMLLRKKRQQHHYKSIGGICLDFKVCPTFTQSLCLTCYIDIRILLDFKSVYQYLLYNCISYIFKVILVFALISCLSNSSYQPPLVLIVNEQEIVKIIP